MIVCSPLALLQDELCPEKGMLSPNPGHLCVCDTFGSRVFADVIKVRSHTVRVRAPNPTTHVMRRRVEKHRKNTTWVWAQGLG